VQTPQAGAQHRLAATAANPRSSLDALNALEFDPWTPVDAAWTPKQSVGVSPQTKAMAEQAE